jgi:hypothetical protein
MSVDQLVQTAIEFLTKTPTPDGFMRLAVTLAQEVNAIRALGGNEKKAVVLDILKQAVQKSPVPEAQKTELLELLKTVVPATLDIAVSVARGGFSLAKPKVGCVAALFRSCLAVAPIDPKLKEMASGVLNKAEAVAKAIEAGESLKDAAVGLAKEATSSEDVKAVVASAVSAVTASVATAEKTVEAVTASVASVATVATVATVEPVAPVTVGIDAPVVIGLLITSSADASQPASVVATAPLPPPEVTAPQDEKKDEEKTEAVQDWGASK